jgi:hypothetical protein
MLERGLQNELVAGQPANTQSTLNKPPRFVCSCPVALATDATKDRCQDWATATGNK